MQTYKAPLNDMKFILRDFINSESNSLLKNSDIDLSDLEMILEEASKLCEEKLLPLLRLLKINSLLNINF